MFCGINSLSFVNYKLIIKSVNINIFTAMYFSITIIIEHMEIP